MAPTAANPRLDRSIARALEENPGMEDPFFILDLDKVVELYNIWKNAMPRAKPFYALKCNPNSRLVAQLANLGTGFDCASKVEIKQILSHGISPKDIIFANTVKYPSHILFAKENGVETMTFDSTEELVKIAHGHQTAKVVLRIKSPENGSKYGLGSKFGADMDEVSSLLKEIKRLGLNFHGVSFHVGNDALSGAPFVASIKDARTVFDLAMDLGLLPTLLDIGGGFSSVTDDGAEFLRIAAAINDALEEYFPVTTNVEIIAEPGSYFAEAAFTLVANVILKRSCGTVEHLYLSDGVFGSLRDAASTTWNHLFQPYVHGNEGNVQDRRIASTKFWGPTCDSADGIDNIRLLPETRVGEWVIVPNWGAYGLAQASSGFNGMPVPEVKGYLVSDQTKTE